MVIMTAVNTISTGSLWLWAGVTVVAMIGLIFTSYRYAVGYFLAGMTYWLTIEAISWLVMAVSPLDSFHAYIFAVALSLIPLMGLLSLKDKGIDITRIDYRAVWASLVARSGMAVNSIAVKSPNGSHVSKTAPRIAGHKPFVLEQDTDFSQHYIRHTPVFNYDN